ncbi:MAG: carboxypeptidase-like regulatory domain-containing protein [Candidatus Muirbacterium halophilum]|nr:carboxypeptidase-like regulatory domain-containing protein [Candidatus Muirbacterium halophilum]MCK9474402.1 carboxypeptidase-like regulatory domain-containing protein [Candidatus Muirbacterium halophilum]
MGLESLIFWGIITGIIIIAVIFVFNYISSMNAKMIIPTGKIKGIIKTSTNKDKDSIKISVAKIKSDDKLAYKVVKDNKGRNIITFTNSYGDFEINNVPVGNYWLVIDKKGYRTMLRMVKVTQNAVTMVDDVTLR